jgi:hypothetical protein
MQSTTDRVLASYDFFTPGGQNHDFVRESHEQTTISCSCRAKTRAVVDCIVHQTTNNIASYIKSNGAQKIEAALEHSQKGRK